MRKLSGSPNLTGRPPQHSLDDAETGATAMTDKVKAIDCKGYAREPVSEPAAG